MSARISGNLAKAIEDVVKPKIQQAASKIADELTQEAQLAIDDFYGHYSPVRYHRQGGLKDSFTRYYRNAHSTIYHGGVELHPGSGSYHGRVNGERVSVGADWVSALSIFNGMHGNVEAFGKPVFVPPRMSPTPFERVTKKCDDIVSHIQDYLN